MHQIEPENDPLTTDDDSLYPCVNNDIEYGLSKDIVDSYYLDSQIKDNFQCDQECYSQYRDQTNDNHSNACTHDYHHIAQNIQDLTDNTQQNVNDTHIGFTPKYPTIHSQRKHAYRDTFGNAHIQYHDFDNQDFSHSKTNILHYYNKNYKIHTGIYMIL